MAISLLALLAAQRLPAAGVPSLPPCFEGLSEHPLPESLERATDVRWAGESEVFVVSTRTGVFRLSLDQPDAAPKLELAAGERRSASWAPFALAVSDSHFAVSALAFAVGWRRRGYEEGLEAQEYFESVPDLDLWREKILVLGMRKNDKGGGYESNGAYVWLGSMGSSGLADLRPLAFSSDGSQARAMDGCAPFKIGAVRFLTDGSFVVAPVCEPGVFLFRSDGVLEHTWQSEELGFDGGCDLSEEQVYQLSVDIESRGEWINARRIVDDVLPLEGRRFGLIIRERVDGSTRWTMEVVSPESRIDRCDVGLSKTSPWVHLRADRRAGRISLLRITRPHKLLGRNEHLSVSPRLFTGRWYDKKSHHTTDREGGTDDGESR
ncbi:MAG TPA: hypothetical protein VGG06_16620 [Thermoanaerobaculia bacterium]